MITDETLTEARLSLQPDIDDTELYSGGIGELPLDMSQLQVKLKLQCPAKTLTSVIAEQGSLASHNGFRHRQQF